MKIYLVIKKEDLNNTNEPIIAFQFAKKREAKEYCKEHKGFIILINKII